MLGIVIESNEDRDERSYETSMMVRNAYSTCGIRLIIFPIHRLDFRSDFRYPKASSYQYESDGGMLFASGR